MSAGSEILVPGRGGEGKALVLTTPISFWVGVDSKTGRIADVRHPQHGENLSGRVLFLPGTIGSSSASAVLSNSFTTAMRRLPSCCTSRTRSCCWG
jgi:predicted aconitase with swiveling domain